MYILVLEEIIYSTILLKAGYFT